MPGLILAGAHPDDELYAAGLLAALSGRSVAVRLLFLTRGEGGGLGSPPVAGRAGIGAVREAEARASAAALGVQDLDFLGYVDPVPDGRARAPEVKPERLAEEIAAVLQRHRPEAVVTHGSNGEYGHPAHRLMHRAARLAAGPPQVLYTFNAAAPDVSLWGGVNPDDPADLILNVTPWLAAKARAFASHVSQKGIWQRPGGPDTAEEYVRASAWRETFRRLGPPDGPDPLRSWLR